MHQNAILQAENDGVRIVGRQECALGGRDCQGLPPLACDANENTVETAAIIAAFLDSQRNLVAQISELSHLDGCAERARTQLEPEALIGIRSEERQVGTEWVGRCRSRRLP